MARPERSSRSLPHATEDCRITTRAAPLACACVSAPRLCLRANTYRFAVRGGELRTELDLFGEKGRSNCVNNSIERQRETHVTGDTKAANCNTYIGASLFLLCGKAPMLCRWLRLDGDRRRTVFVVPIDDDPVRATGIRKYKRKSFNFNRLPDAQQKYKNFATLLLRKQFTSLFDIFSFRISSHSRAEASNTADDSEVKRMICAQSRISSKEEEKILFD